MFVIAWHRNLQGELLDRKTAAVELINVLRPTVAIGRFIIFSALALHEHPEEKQKLIDDSEENYLWFVQEVRRFYPFFPAAVARVKEDFKWQDYLFPKGSRVLLDLYGTNHDERLWSSPSQFQADRFRHWNQGEFNFISQGEEDTWTATAAPENGSPSS